jgi:octaprenyl-diphosphate synthase
MESLENIKMVIKDEMGEFEGHFKQSLNNKIPLLNYILNYLYRTKGKQMRPMFVFLSAKMHGNVNDSTYTAASLIELLHTATLVHDDVADESFERRGLLSINAIWKSKVAVLVGDYLLSKGLLLAVRDKQYSMLERMSDAVREMSEGEIMQIQFSRNLSITKDEYFEVIRKKTATFIATCTACGTSSVIENEEIINKMKAFGMNIGMAFQIKDDLLDYGVNGSIGKPVGKDIKEKKLTLPLIFALENTDQSTRKEVLSIVKHHNKNPKKLQEAISFVNASGGLEYSLEKMNEYKDRALTILQEFPSNASKESLINLVKYTTERNH